MEQHALKNVNSCWNTKVFFNFGTSGDQNSNLYLNVVHFFTTNVNQTSVAAYDRCFITWVSIACVLPKTLANVSTVLAIDIKAQKQIA